MSSQEAGTKQHVDSMLMYCSYFTNGKKSYEERRKMTEARITDIAAKLAEAENRDQIPKGTTKELEKFYASDDQAQRKYFDEATNKKMGEAVIRGSFKVIQNFKADQTVISFVLSNLDGILEDKRSRVKLFYNVMTDWKDNVDLVGILNSFLHTAKDDPTQLHKESASHILALLIEEAPYEKYKKDADEFLDWLTCQRDLDNLDISITAYTFCLMTMLKTNQLAQKYCNHASFKMISDMLDKPCLKHAQVGYNVLCMLWVLSYHSYARNFFQDYTLSIIEKACKILDFFNWEKIARMLLMLFDNLKEDSVCQDHFSDIDAHSLIIKLQNRHWVDQDINDRLEKLFTYFDVNQKVFSSIDKLRNQVQRKQLRWGPCHTEKFWQENIILFDKDASNLQLIGQIVECLEVKDDKIKAVACYDLGEFARFFPHGKRVLNQYDVKSKMADLMADQKVSAEVKKEAITCFQKLLMNTWNPEEFKGGN